MTDEPQTTEAVNEEVQNKARQRDEIADLEKHVTNLKIKWEELQTETKMAKESHQYALDRLLSAARPDDQQTLPFPQSSDAWRDESIDVLQLPGKLPEKLRGEGIDTLGALETYRKNDALADIEGVGAGAIQTIDDAMIDYWKLHVETTDGEETEDEEEDGTGGVEGGKSGSEGGHGVD